MKVRDIKITNGGSITISIWRLLEIMMIVGALVGNFYMVKSTIDVQGLEIKSLQANVNKLESKIDKSCDQLMNHIMIGTP